MRLRTGKTIASGVTVPVTTNYICSSTADRARIAARASKAAATTTAATTTTTSVTTTAATTTAATTTAATTTAATTTAATTITTVDPANYTKYREIKPKTTIEVLNDLVNYAQTGTVPEKMLKISLIYDIILADAEFRRNYSDSTLIKTMCEKAKMHLEHVNSESILQRMDTDELRAAQRHFCCLLEKFIDGSFGTPKDYLEYSYHYDMMRKIGYEEASYKKYDIFDYAYDVDYDIDLVGDYIKNEVTVYEVYAMVTYNTYEALPNDVSYEYCFNEVLSWFMRDKRD